MNTELAPLPTNTTEQYKAVFDSLKYEMVDRDECLDCLQLAFLTGQHLLVWGETGEGKTYLTNEVFTRFADPEKPDDVFKIQFTRDMPPEVLFGGYDIKALQVGTVKYNVENSLLTCNFMFGDEIFDAPDFVLRTMLGALSEERTFRFGQQVFKDLPLQSAVLTSNFRRDNPATQAFLNRVLLQYKISPEASLAHRAMLDTLGEARKYHQPAKETLPFKDLQALSNIVIGENEQASILLPWSVVFLKDKIIDAFVQVARERQVDLADETGQTQALQKEMLGVDLATAEKETIAQELGLPLSLFKDKLAPLLLASAQRIASAIQTKERQAEEFRVSSSRGMQLTHLLYASALLDNRQIVTPRDLAMVRFGLYPQAEQPTVLDACFQEAVRNVLTQTSPQEIAQAEEILACVNLTDFLAGKAAKAVIPAQLASGITGFTNENVGFGEVEQKLADITPISQTALELRAAASMKIEKAKQITQGKPIVNLREHPKVFILEEERK